MEKTINADVNQFPTLTYNFLKINRGHLETAVNAVCVPQSSPLPEGISLSSEKEGICADFETGMGKQFDSQFDEVIKECGIKPFVYTIAEGAKIPSPVKLVFTAGKNESSASELVIAAEKDSESVFIMEYNGAEGGAFGLRTRIIAAENATVHVIKVNLLSKDAVHFDSTGTVAEENAVVKVDHIELGAKETYSGLNNLLKGRKSQFAGKTGYAAKDEQKIDINYAVRQTGKETESEMKVYGVVTDKAQKVWRGTIDFVKGARNAIGNETEDVLLLNPDVVNKTLPVILCDEEAVEGHHGASIGRLDDDMLFYLNSRGVDVKNAEKLMINAKINSVSAGIDDEELKEKISEYLEEAFS